MKTLCITGGIASGKSLVSQYLKSLGYTLIDSDVITHELLLKESVLKEINAFFPSAFVAGSLDKKKLADIIFSDKEAKKHLDDIMHQKVYKAIFTELKKHKHEQIVVIDVPLVYETNKQDLFDYVLLVYVDYETQLNRLMSRNQYTKQEAKNRILSQSSLEEKVKKATFVVDNRYTITDTYNQVNDILKIILKEV